MIKPFYGLEYVNPALGEIDFALLVLSTLLIASGGYVINDYFDKGPDKINKPGKNLIGKSISAEATQILYWLLSITGILIGFYLSYKVNYLMLGFIFIAIVMMLWLYSSKYQKTVLWGNLAISSLSAMVILIVWLFEFFALRANPVKFAGAMKQFSIISILIAGYTLFAFLVSLIREIVKDIEDIEGDKDAGYRTLPIFIGVKKSSLVVSGIILISIGLLAYGQFMLFQNEFKLVFWYLMIAVQTLLIYLLYNTFTAHTKEDFHFLSNAAKILMVAGILSMQLFCVSV